MGFGVVVGGGGGGGGGGGVEGGGGGGWRGSAIGSFIRGGFSQTVQTPKCILGPSNKQKREKKKGGTESDGFLNEN